MFLSKKLFNSSFKGIKISYIIIEVVLIFIGVTFANLAYEKSLEKKDKKFITESLVLYRDELTSNIKTNKHLISNLEDLQKEFNEFYNSLQNDAISEYELIENQKGFVTIVFPYFLPAKQTGLNNIINRDINLIKDFDFITTLGNHKFMMDYLKDSFDYYDDETFKLYDILIEHISVDFNENKITGFKNLESLRNNVKFNNQLNHVIYLRKLHIRDLRLLNEVHLIKMIESIDEYLNQ